MGYFPINDDDDNWYQMSWYKRMEFVMMFHYACGCFANSIYLRVLSLLKLTQICYENGYYLFGIKCLKCAYNLCVINGDLLPSFTIDGYHKWRRKFNRMSRNRRCVWCGGGSANWKQMTCASCMRVEYCSKECQIAHWQSSSESCHRDECLSSWLIVNRMLDQRLFSRIKCDLKTKQQMKRRYKEKRHQRKLKIVNGWMRRHSCDSMDFEIHFCRMIHLVMHYWEGYRQTNDRRKSQ